MISNQPDPTTDPPTGRECRWTMNPHTGAQGLVDGGWWPWSTDPATEFPPLITAMAALGMPVLRVSYNLDTWDPSERRLTVRDTVVRLESFHTTQPHTVTMIGPDRAQTRLLVIPPATPGGAARAALRAAADIDSAATAEDILRWNNVPVPDGRAGTTAQSGWRTVGTESSERRESDGGTLDLGAALRRPRREALPTEDRAAS
ncbi:hypothetical protein ALI22I_05880 [Saccharothrix sp. ALI-22-I]|uniref:DUF5994 family protein n=1 Tax=Saccharothrix sp. ALI-22-I TaxID=1933778 RepID=UPI00097BAB08|nr:DUF5994 family protein [Saccharothrix sp. ALI-22-I]ONI92129.1 hypothetical protein ALI22I_05880 [Saccharothrix sp. ALI-22-I]